MHFENKEQLTSYMILGSVHLNRKDYHFFSNLQNAIKAQHHITTNQDKLFNKLLLKYSRQLKKLGYNTETLANLPWKNDLVPSLPSYTVPKIYVDNGTIKIKSPYNTKFLTTLRQQSFNPFKWNKVNKVHEAKYSTYAFKVALHHVKNAYEDYILCDELQTAIKTYNEFNDLVWQPTLVKVANHYYIIAASEPLMLALNNLELNDDPKTLYELSKYGVSISKNMVCTEEQRFACSRHLTFTNENVNDLGKLLHNIGVQQITVGRELSYHNKISHLIKESCHSYNISVKTYSYSFTERLDSEVYIQYHRGDFGNQDPKIYKVILIQSNIPVDVK